MKEIKANFGQSGYAAGKVVYIGRLAGEREKRENVPGSELARFMHAVDKMTQVLGKALDNATEKNSKVIEAELMLLNDMEFCGAIINMIETGKVSASDAVRFIGQKSEETLLAGADEYVSERVQDIKGITNGLIDILEGREDNRSIGNGEPVIIVTEEMTTYDMASISQENILGIITQNGSKLCHVSIMAGNLGIPYAYGADINIKEIMGFSCAVMSGEKGSIILCSDDELSDVSMTSQWDEQCHVSAENTDISLAKNIQTKTGIYLNLSGCEDVKRLSATSADGVGLLRSEFMFLTNDYPPTEQEQYEAYVRILEAMGDRTVVIRVFDIGGDKNVPWLEDKVELNPAMGSKGVRLLLNHREILDTQLRALLRAAAHGNLKIMIPMIATKGEMSAVRKIAEEIAEDLRLEGTDVVMPAIGATIETPAAALTSDDIAEQSDFFSIGTNDLTQYTLAIGREDSTLDDYFDMGNEAVLRLVRMTVKAAHDNGIKAVVCGELASDPVFIPKLVEAGVDGLSVSLERADRTRIIAKEAENKC